MFLHRKAEPELVFQLREPSSSPAPPAQSAWRGQSSPGNKGHPGACSRPGLPLQWSSWSFPVQKALLSGVPWAGITITTLLDGETEAQTGTEGPPPAPAANGFSLILTAGVPRTSLQRIKLFFVFSPNVETASLRLEGRWNKIKTYVISHLKAPLITFLTAFSTKLTAGTNTQP